MRHRLVSIVVLGASLSLIGGAPVATARPVAPTPLSALAAGNKLIALPWSGLSKQFEADTEKAILALDGKVLANTGTQKLKVGHNNTRFRWSLRQWITNVSADLDIASPPGLRSETPLTRFQFEAPLNGAWEFATAATLNNDVKVWDKDSPHHPIFSCCQALRLGVKITNFKVVAKAAFDAADPGRPRLVTASILPRLNLGGSGVIPGSIPITFAVTYNNVSGTVTLRGSFGFTLAGAGAVGAQLNGDAVIVLRPIAGTDGNMSEPRFARYEVAASLQGDVSVHFSVDSNGGQPGGNLTIEGKTPWRYASIFELPAMEELELLKTPLPKTWGEDDARGKASPVTGATHFGATADALEQAIPSHLPNGTILAIDRRQSEFDPKTKPALSYAIEADSATWTGHYLAAESYRHAATGSSAALERLKVALGGIERLFYVAQDAVIENGRRSPVTTGPGLFARTALPSDSQIDYTPDPTNKPSSGPLQERPCYYEHPEGGWQVVVGGTPRGKYQTFALADQAADRKAEIRPLGRVWRGWGCGSNMPLSRDALVSVVMGLGIAHMLVHDADVQQRSERLIKALLDLVSVDWNLHIPPDNRVVRTSSFIGDFPKQLAFLRIGKTVDPSKYGPVYDEVANAAELTWITEWFDSVEPVEQYFKFNLSHAAFASALLLENDPTLRARWMPGYAILWRAVSHHQNAYFELLRILVQTPAQRPATAGERAPSDPTNPGNSLAKEIRSVLRDWVTRYELVKTPGGLPMLALPNPKYQVDLWSQGGIGTYTSLGKAGKVYAAKFALPVSGRVGSGMEWTWQRHPFGVALQFKDTDNKDPKCDATPPTGAQLATCDSKGVWASREASGDDYLIAYWLARYLGVLRATD